MFTVPLIGNETLTIDVSSPLGDQPLPLLVWAINLDDPWSAAALTVPSSLDSFLLGGGKSSSTAVASQTAPLPHYLFAGYDDDGSSVHTLHDALFERMDVLGFSASAVAVWDEHLHFVDGGLPGWADTAVASVLQAWQSPINTLVITGGDGLEFTRLDGHYGWCLWPGEIEEGATVVDGGVACDPALGGLNCSQQASGSCDYVLVTMPDDDDGGSGVCTPEIAARMVALAGGSKRGVIVALAASSSSPNADAVLIEIGAAADIDGLDVIVTAVGAAAGTALKQALANASLASAAIQGAGDPFPSVAVTLNYTAAPGFFVSVDSEGALQQVGWQKYPALSMLCWAAQWLAYTSDLEARLTTAHPVQVQVQVFEKQWVQQSASASVVLPSEGKLRQQLVAGGYGGSMAVDFALSCQGSRDEDCSVWNHVATLTVECDGVDPSEPTMQRKKKKKKKKTPPLPLPPQIMEQQQR